MARKTKCDFSDPDAVLKHMAKELGYEASDLEIEEDSGLGGFISDTVYRIESGTKEWFVVENDDVERELALAIVKQDLEQEPEIFEHGFLVQHINEDRLRRDLESDTESANLDYYHEQDDDDLLRSAESEGIDIAPFTEEPDEEEEEGGGELTITDRDGLEEALAEHKTAEDLKDPIAYLQDIYGDEDGLKKAIEIAGIDVDAAAEEAVNVDGAAHFLSSYDGRTSESDCGFIWWRHN